MTYIPPYKPREGTKLAEACDAMDKAGGIGCGPLADLLGCDPYKVATFMRTPLEKGYVRKELRDGVAHYFVVKQDLSNGFVFPPKKTVLLEDVLHERTHPTPAPKPKSDADEIAEKIPTFAERLKPTELQAKLEAFEASPAPPVPFAFVFTTAGEIRISHGSQNIAMNRGSAKLLMRVLCAMDVAELLS